MRINKTSLGQRLRSLIAGTQKHTPNESLMFGGAAYTAPELIALLQSLDDATTAMDAARAKWQDAVKSQRTLQGTIGPVAQAYRTFLVAKYGAAVQTLADYGLTPRKAPVPQTAEQKATAVAKRQATRVARHTLGKKKKALIKGTTAVAAGAVAPATTPQAPKIA